MSEKVFKFLDDNEVDYKLHHHKPVFTVEEAKITRKTIRGIHSKNLFTKDAKRNQFFLITAPADQEISLNSIRKQIKAKKLSLASEIELMEHCKVKPGSVSFLNLINTGEKVKFLVFKQVLEAEIVTFHPNDNSKTLEISNLDFHKLLEILAPDYHIIS